MTLVVGDVFEQGGARWVVTNVIRNVATVRSLTVSGLTIPADSNVEVLCNPQKDWVFVPIKRTGPVGIVSVSKPYLLHGGSGTQPLAHLHDWLDAGAGIYVNPLVGLLRGDVLNVAMTNGRVIQARIKSLDTLTQKIERTRVVPQEPVTAFDRLLQDDDD
jgi:hypothetical protein